ncbi:hypothetical protein QVD17_20115 [Tagetes erecta]|uniref:DUF4283 domain-containing protein n=1 Tax=Tagetes erecta TaxID=13708 RepID=A0AAD8KKY7_TARER|nr:hypothetical protein QVD17_20115 [Tagetes erecta]
MNISKSRSFADVLTNTNIRPNERIITISPEEENFMRPNFLGSFVARAKDLNLLNQIHSLASQAKIRNMDIRYLGGLFTLLSFPSQEEANNFHAQTNTWGNWFSKIEPWRGQSIPYERIAWLRIHGVPPHLWNPVVFNKIGSSYGRLLQTAEANWDDANFSYECVGVLVNSGTPINDDFILKWCKKSFRCWTNEVPVDWKPNCIDKSSGLLPVTSSDAIVDPMVVLQDVEDQVNHPKPMDAEILPSKNGDIIDDNNTDADNSTHMPENFQATGIEGGVILTVNMVRPLNDAINEHAAIGTAVHTSLGKVQNPITFLGPLITRNRRYKKKFAGTSTAPPCGVSPNPTSSGSDNSSGPDLAQRTKKRKCFNGHVAFNVEVGMQAFQEPLTTLKCVSNPLSPQSLPNPGSNHLGTFDSDSSASMVPDSFVTNMNLGTVIEPVSDGHEEPINNINDEIEATKIIADCLGVNLDGFEDSIKDAIISDGVQINDP